MTRRHRFLDYPHPIAFAHRGGSLEAEENTMEAFARAVALGFTHVETDVHATRDGVIVVHHDETLERMTGDRRRIADLDWSDLAPIRTHGGAAIPRLVDVFDAFPGLCVNIELKSDAGTGALAAAIAQARALDRVCVGSFSDARVRALRRALGPDLLWSPAMAGVLGLWLGGWGLPVAVDNFAVVQVPTQHRGIAVVTPRVVAAARRRGIEVQVWTVDEAPEMTRLLDIGVRGIMTDRPSLLRDVLLARGQWNGPAP